MLTIKQVAKELSVSIRTVYKLIKEGKLKAIKLGATGPDVSKSHRSWRIREEDFEEFIKPKGG